MGHAEPICVVRSTSTGRQWNVSSGSLAEVAFDAESGLLAEADVTRKMTEARFGPISESAHLARGLQPRMT